MSDTYIECVVPGKPSLRRKLIYILLVIVTVGVFLFGLLTLPLFSMVALITGIG